LYSSLYNKPERHISIIGALGKKRKGLTREEIVKLTGLPNGGSLTETLNELVLSGFIRTYKSFSKKKKGELYQLVDHFSLFYFAFIEDSPDDDVTYWHKMSEGVRYKSWRGYAFEQVCLAHVRQIRLALSIDGIISRSGAWRSEVVEPGAQIDLLLDRNDGLVTLCEMKFSETEYELTKRDDIALERKREVFVAETGTKKAVQIVMVTSSGLKRNSYYHTIQAEVTANDLFA
jgi:hypothetical protein